MRSISTLLLAAAVTATVAFQINVANKADREQLAGRYYLRNRTQNFFQRAAPQRNYYQQYRVAPVVTPPAATPAVKPAPPAVPKQATQAAPENQLATRYYLRNRTRNFYRRARA